MPAYSFLDITASISGSGGSFSLKGGNAPEGITVVADADMTETVTGADGVIMHSLMEQGRTCTVTVTLLKTSPVNAQLQQLINSQSQSSATWGDNVISIRDVVRGDDLTISDAAYIRQSDVNYAAAGGTMAWTFRGRATAVVLGSGLSRE
ncbi:MAG: DUF3277 family protein [Synergistaceae bacterium]|jgi:hypothetical protein|nr:DUF3277 family protein [Synergistaceae bacterium]